jgi:hypothetical protein
MSTDTYIYEDKGDKNEKKLLWYSLDGSTTKICPFIVLPKKNMGCQYLNPHNVHILKAFNFNTSVQIEDDSKFSTVHSTQANQHKEDSGKQLHIGCAVIKRIKRPLDEKLDECNKATSEPSFNERLSRVLSGLSAAKTRNVISAAMAHLIPSNQGSCFFFCINFQIY